MRPVMKLLKRIFLVSGLGMLTYLISASYIGFVQISFCNIRLKFWTWKMEV